MACFTTQRFFSWFVRGGPKGFLQLILVVLFWCPVAAFGEREVLIVPLGQGEALEPTVRVSQAMAAQLAKTEQPQGRARLFYPLPPLPPADPGLVRRASHQFKRAIHAYEMMEYDAAKKEIDAVLTLQKQILKTASAHEGYLEALHLLAAIYLLQGQEKLAHKTMNDAFIFAERPPDKKKFNPTVQELFMRVRAESPGQSKILIRSEGPTIIWLNTQCFGLSETTATTRSGRYLLRAWRPGHDLFQCWVRLDPHSERTLDIRLTANQAPPANDPLDSLRQEASAEKPGPVIHQFMQDHSTSELLLVTSSADCTAARCAVELRWAKDQQWVQKTRASYVGQPEPVAVALLGIKTKATSVKKHPGTPGQGEGSACLMESECSFNLRCRDGRCVRVVPLTRKWWFWTLVGAAVVGVTLSIALPLSGPERPIIEVQ